MKEKNSERPKIKGFLESKLEDLISDADTAEALDQLLDRTISEFNETSRRFRRQVDLLEQAVRKT